MIRPKVPTRAGSLSTLAYALSARQGRSTTPGGADAEGDDRHGLTGSEARYCGCNSAESDGLNCQRVSDPARSRSSIHRRFSHSEASFLVANLAA
jgi:hypothetical protein